jgi:hypothetical protein
MHHKAVHNPKKANDHAPNLGLGLKDWESHCVALRIKWILNYLDASQGPWKLVLDAWLARPKMGRASICTSTHTSQLIKAIDNKPSLPPFWIEAVKEFRLMKLNRIDDSDANHRSQPLWTNPHALPPKMYHAYRWLWQNFGTLKVDNIINGTRFYTEDETANTSPHTLPAMTDPALKSTAKHTTVTNSLSHLIK